MSFCIKCGGQLAGGMTFCPHCGAKISDRGSGGICVTCGAQLDDGQLFCSSCGTICQKSVEVRPSVEQTLTFSRRSQFVASSLCYEAFVDGVSIGELRNGKSVSTRVLSNTVYVEICCTDVKLETLWILLEVTQNPYPDSIIEIYTKYFSTGRFTIMAEVARGAKILEQNYRR